MVDRDKVIKGLECCLLDGWETCHNCPYYCGNCHECTTRMKSDALALLKEQEPVKPIYDEDNYIRCGKCKHHIVGLIARDTGNAIPIQKYCGKCGQAVKW